MQWGGRERERGAGERPSPRETGGRTDGPTKKNERQMEMRDSESDRDRKREKQQERQRDSKNERELQKD